MTITHACESSEVCHLRGCSYLRGILAFGLRIILKHCDWSLASISQYAKYDDENGINFMELYIQIIFTSTMFLTSPR